jgi:membrane-bound lytic murein transglycosylase D
MHLRTQRPHPLAASAAALFLSVFLLTAQPPSSTGSSPLNPGLHEVALPDFDGVGPGKPASTPPAVRDPALLIPKAPAAEPTGAVQRALREADRHFQYGKFCIQEGKPDEARREFDAAIDVLLNLPPGLPDRDQAERKFEELIRQIHRYDLESLGAGVPLDQPVYTQSPLNDILDLTFPVDPSLKDKVLAQVQAVQSQLPLEVNDAVLSYINFFRSPRGARIFNYGWKHAGRYRVMISRILAEEGIPQELIHIAQAESAFMPMAISRKTATGMWQFLRSRGKEYGLDASRTYDERLDPEKATRAAARHLRDLYNQVGDWYLAMAAYNCGPYCIERAVQRTGYADFWELRRRNVLPKETMNYVPAILAMAIIAKDPQAYGIELVEQDPPLQYETVHISAPTNLGLMADAADVPTADIRELNPSLLRPVAPADTDVHVPVGKARAVLAAIEAVPEAKREGWRLHRIVPGDTLASIARHYALPAKSILAANARFDAAFFFDAPSSGEVLLIPAAAPANGAAKARTPAGRGKATSRGASSRTPARTAPVAGVHRTSRTVRR